MSYVLVVVIARDYLYLFVSFSPKLHFRVWTRSTVWRHYGVNGVTQHIFTKPLGSGVVRLFIRKVKFGTAFVVHVGVGTFDVCAGTSDDVGSSDPNYRDFQH